MSAKQVGKVFLVGAGPGDPELLTLKAVRALAAADVILVDDLVNTEVLEHATRRARIIHVGKRGGCQSTPQAFIEKLMVAEALAGNVVVRLKGGDPFMFGRGGEEVATLRDAGIECEIVNGITAGLAAPSSIGVPLTHRDFCHGVAFFTGHTKNESMLRLQPLIEAGLTLVIYMGISNLPEIVDQLHSQGARPALPIAVIQDATLPSQRVLICTLESVVEQVAVQRMASPSVIVIGDVVTLNRAVDDRGDLPILVAPELLNPLRKRVANGGVTGVVGVS